MATEEKLVPKIITGVAVGVILLIFGYIGRNWIPPFLRWLRVLFNATWNWLFSGHLVYGWLILVLSLCGVCCLVYCLAAACFPSKPAEPHWTEFTEFEFLGVFWRWSYYGGDVQGLASFCVRSGCDMQTFAGEGPYFGHGRESSLFRCDRCGNSESVNGTRETIQDRVIREIQRQLRTGEWRQHLKAKAVNQA